MYMLAWLQFVLIEFSSPVTSRHDHYKEFW